MARRTSEFDKAKEALTRLMYLKGKDECLEVLAMFKTRRLVEIPTDQLELFTRVVLLRLPEVPEVLGELTMIDVAGSNIL